MGMTHENTKHGCEDVIDEETTVVVKVVYADMPAC